MPEIKSRQFQHKSRLYLLHRAIRLTPNLGETAMISSSLISVILGSLMMVAIADQAPEYDVAPSCRSLAMLSYSVETCMNDEKAAREKLMSRWTQFEGSDRD